MNTKLHKIIFLVLFWFFSSDLNAQTNLWSTEKANEWYKKQGWLVGSNFTPAYAINQLEFWQADTFDPIRIDKELGWAHKIGMNTMRVFLHDLLYQQDPNGFLDRIDQFLRIANKHHVKIMFVLFDSCWDPNPFSGKQREPKPGVHNSGWVQSPGADALRDSSQYLRLERYVKAVIGHYSKDPRILIWDLWNEPDNMNQSSYGKIEPHNKIVLVNNLLEKSFQWARAENPSQPLTSGLWIGGHNWSVPEALSPTEKIQLRYSDIITYHSYDLPAEFEKRIISLQVYNRPILCTEYMARPRGNTFQNALPLGKRYNVGMYNWGFVEGKTQTNYPWDSWEKAYLKEPALWFHDIFRINGIPYMQAEVDFIKQLSTLKKSQY